MNVEQCYRAFGGDYNGTAMRLVKTELLTRLLRLFEEDTSLEDIDNAIAAGDVESAFRAAHTLKGVALNLGFTELAASSSALTEYFRSGALDGCGKLRDTAARDYNRVKDALRMLDR